MGEGSGSEKGSERKERTREKGKNRRATRADVDACIRYFHRASTVETMRVKIEGEDAVGSYREETKEQPGTSEPEQRGTVGRAARGLEGVPVDGDSTKQRCLIGVGPHQVDRGPPSRVFEGSTPTTRTRTTTTWGLRSRRREGRKGA